MAWTFIAQRIEQFFIVFQDMLELMANRMDSRRLEVSTAHSKSCCVNWVVLCKTQQIFDSFLRLTKFEVAQDPQGRIEVHQDLRQAPAIVPNW